MNLNFMFEGEIVFVSSGDQCIRRFQHKNRKLAVLVHEKPRLMTTAQFIVHEKLSMGFVQVLKDQLRLLRLQ